MKARLGPFPVVLIFLFPSVLLYFLFDFISILVPGLKFFELMISIVYVSLVVFVYYKNKIELQGNTLTINSFVVFPGSRKYGGLANPSFHPQTSRHKVIEINTISGIEAVTTTPLIPDRNSFEQLNWRDKIVITYVKTDQQVDTATVELYIFPGFKKILKQILVKRSDIQLAFRKHTIIDNMTQSPNPDYQ